MNGKKVQHMENLYLYSRPKFVKDICGDMLEGCEEFAKRGDCDGSQPENLNFTLYKKIGTARDMLVLCRTTCR